jgi:hypothetical protein
MGPPRGHSVCRLLGLVCRLLTGCALSWPGISSAAAAAAEIDVTPRRVALIPPGTVIPDRAPKDWTHLIIKSHPRIGPESIGQVSASTARLAGLLFTAVLADVQAGRGAEGGVQFVLSNIAVGVGTRVNGRDLILSSDTQEKLGANLGFLEGSVLAAGERQLQQMRSVARSRTMAIVDAPGILLRDGRHRQVVLRYALLVDPKSGRLDTLLWLLEPGGRGPHLEPLSLMQWLPPDKIEDCVLHVDSNEFILGIPTSTAFAMAQIPQGRLAIAFPRELKATAAEAQFTPASAESLQRTLWSLLRRAAVAP